MSLFFLASYLLFIFSLVLFFIHYCTNNELNVSGIHDPLRPRENGPDLDLDPGPGQYPDQGPGPIPDQDPDREAVAGLNISKIFRSLN